MTPLSNRPRIPNPTSCLLLVNLWALGAFSSHHIVRQRSIGSNAGSRIWDPRPVGQRSHSYTATMDGGDLRRIMLKTISNLPDAVGLVSCFLFHFFKFLFKRGSSRLYDIFMDSFIYSLYSDTTHIFTLSAASRGSLYGNTIPLANCSQSVALK